LRSFLSLLCWIELLHVELLGILLRRLKPFFCLGYQDVKPPCVCFSTDLYVSVSLLQISHCSIQGLPFCGHKLEFMEGLTGLVGRRGLKLWSMICAKSLLGRRPCFFLDCSPSQLVMRSAQSHETMCAS